MLMQCLGAICGAGVVKGFQPSPYQLLGGGANVVNHGYTKGDGLGAEIVGTFVLVYTVFSATDAKRSARDSHVPVSIYAMNQFILFLYSKYPKHYLPPYRIFFEFVVVQLVEKKLLLVRYLFP